MAQDPKKPSPHSAAPKPAAQTAAPAQVSARNSTKPSSKPAPVAPPAPPETPTGQLMLKVKDLVDRVTDATGGKRAQVKDIVEATLAILGGALDAGETLNLPPIGKIRVAKAPVEGGNSAMTIKVRKGNPPKEKAPKPPKEPKNKEKNGGGGKGGAKGKQTLAEDDD